MSSGKWRPFCLGLNVLKAWCLTGDKPLPWHVVTKIHEAIVALWPPMVSDFGQHWFKYWYDTMLAPAIISTSVILLLIEPSLTLWHQSKMADILQAAFRMHFL